MPNKKALSQQFTARTRQLIKDGKDFFKAFILAEEEYLFKLDLTETNTGEYAFIDGSIAIYCGNNKWNHFQTYKK